jgi:hypothetical protein
MQLEQDTALAELTFCGVQFERAETNYAGGASR